MGWIKRILSRLLWKMDELKEDQAFATKHHAETYNKEENTEIGEERINMIEAVEVYEESLSAVLGLDSFKDYYRCLARENLLRETRGDSGFKSNSISIHPMVFIGNRGTERPTKIGYSWFSAKSMAAEMLGRLHCSKVHEVEWSDLVVYSYAQCTIEKTRKAMQAMQVNGTMVVNGVHTLEKSYNSRYYGSVALGEIKNLMGEYNINPIFTAPRGLSKKVLDRVGGVFGETMKVFEFVDYSIKDLAQMVHAKMNDQGEKSPCKGFKLHPECTVHVISKLLKKKTNKKQRSMNGVLVSLMLENARVSLDARVSLPASGKELVTIFLEDLEKGLQSIRFYP